MNIGIVGKHKVGKTSLRRRLTHNSFSILYRPTILTEYFKVIYNNRYKIIWWDIVQPPKIKLDGIILVTRDNDHSILKQYPPLPTWVACIERSKFDIKFCAYHRIFRISNMENKGICELLTSILKYYTSSS